MQPNDSSFEEPLAELRRKIEELEGYPAGTGHDQEISQLRAELERQTAEVYGNLSRWQKTLVARHAERPYTLDYVQYLIDGLGRAARRSSLRATIPPSSPASPPFADARYASIGHQKGRGTKERILRNFGQPRPEGYRKALRVMRMAERFQRPILTFVDTPGAYPGLDAEERGQAEAIARNLIEMSSLGVPIVVTVTGEGGSGGALALGIGDRVFMLEYAVYSVISPEGCAAILWKDQDKKAEAAEAMKMTAPDLLRAGRRRRDHSRAAGRRPRGSRGDGAAGGRHHRQGARRARQTIPRTVARKPLSQVPNARRPPGDLSG